MLKCCESPIADRIECCGGRRQMSCIKPVKTSCFWCHGCLLEIEFSIARWRPLICQVRVVRAFPKWFGLIHSMLFVNVCIRSAWRWDYWSLRSPSSCVTFDEHCWRLPSGLREAHSMQECSREGFEGLSWLRSQLPAGQHASLWILPTIYGSFTCLHQKFGAWFEESEHCCEYWLFMYHVHVVIMHVEK